MRVPGGDECYVCWDDRRRKNPGKSQAWVNEKMKTDKKFKDKQTSSRAERVRNARKPGMEGVDASTRVVSQQGAFRENFDEGHFYNLDDYLSLHFAGIGFSSFKAKVKAVESNNEVVVQDKQGTYGVNVSLLPAKAAYKWKSGTAESFKKVCADDLDDATEADQFLDQSVDNSGLQDSVVDSRNLGVGDDEESASQGDLTRGDDFVCESEADATEELQSVQSELELEKAVCRTHHQLQSPDTRSVRSTGLLRGSPLSSRNPSPRSAQPRAPSPSESQHPPLPRSSTFRRRLNASRLAAPRAVSVNSSQSAAASYRTPCEVPLDQSQGLESGDAAEPDTQKKGRRKAVQTLDEAQEAYDEYLTDFTALNFYESKYKLRDVNAAVDRLRKIGNKVACMQGDEAADLAGKLVAFADTIKPLYDIMDFVRTKPFDFLRKLKPDQVSTFKALPGPGPLMQQLMSNIALSVLPRLPNSSTKADDILDAMEFVSRHKHAQSQDGDRVHLALVSEVDQDGFERAQSHLLVVLLEAMMKLPKIEYVKVMRRLRSEGLAPTLDDHESGSAAWTKQAWIDISACSFMGYILESEEADYKKSRIFFSTMARFQTIKADVSVRLKTFRGAKKSSGDGDVGRYCWNALEKTQSHAAEGAASSQAQEAAALWAKIKEDNVLPLEDDMTIPEAKQVFIAAYEASHDDKPLKLAQLIAQVGTDLAELGEAEAALQLGMSRYWDVLSEECDDEFINGFKVAMAGDNDKYIFRFQTVVEIVRLYDTVTVELDPHRQSSVAISELRERLLVANEALDLSLQVVLDPVENLNLWSNIWVKHMKVQNTRPNADFVLKDERVQALLTSLREVTVVTLIQSFLQRNLELGCNPSNVLVSHAQKKRGQLPESLGPIFDRASCINRIERLIQDKSIGRVSGPCEVTALKSDANSVLKGFEKSPGVQEVLMSLDSIWLEAYNNWVTTARFDDFDDLHTKFQGVYEALKSGDITGHDWLEMDTDGTEWETDIRRYQDILLRSLPVKAAAGAMAQHLMDESVGAEVDQILKDSTNVVSKARQIELALASIAMANTILMKPRHTDFSKQYAISLGFVTNSCKCKPAQLPKYVQTLMKAETEAIDSKDSKKPKQQPATPSTAAGPSSAAGSSSASDAASPKTPAAAAEAELEPPTRGKRRKLA